MKKKKKRKLKYKRIIILLLILLLIITLTITFLKIFKKSTNPSTKDNKTQETVSTTNNDKTYKATMVMVGDNIIHESVFKDARKNANNQGYDFKPMYELVKPIISNYDIAYVNQETVIGGSELGVSGYPTFNSPYEVGDDLIDTGFNLVSLATNHLLDSGVTAVKNSREYWNKKSNVLAAGSYMSEEERNKVDIRKVNNITYTMLNYTYGINGNSISEDYLVNVWPTSNLNATVSEDTVKNDTKYQNYKEQVKKDIANVRDKVDVLIVAMHWGVEYSSAPTAYQIDAAKFLSEQGVNIIIGTHPHVIEPVTWVGDTLVYYSLGNFLSSQYQTDNYNKVVGLMGTLEITKTIKDNKSTIKITDTCSELLYTYYEDVGSGLRGNIKIIPFSQMNTNYLSNYKSVYETYKNIVQKYDSNICVKEVS